METQIYKKNKKGFTLVEVLVAVAIFVSVLVIAGLAFMYAIRIQRENLAHQEILDQISYTMEYMSRGIRMAKIQTSPPVSFPCGTLNSGDSYDINLANDSIGFLQYIYDRNAGPTGALELVCTQFYKDVDALKIITRKVADGSYYIGSAADGGLRLSSPEMQVTEFYVRLVPASDPDMVEIDLKIKGREEIEIQLQTTISQRDFREGP